MCNRIYKPLTDEHLALLVQQNDMSAMEELYARYFIPVVNKSLSFTKNTEEARDLAQDVMLKVMEKINSFKGESKFSTWLYAITFNYCVDQTRKSSAKHFVSLDLDHELYEHAEIEYETAIKKELKMNTAEKALSAVSHKDRQLLIMKYQFNKSIQDLQNMYNLSSSAVKMRLLRAREKAVSVYSTLHTTAA